MDLNFQTRICMHMAGNDLLWKLQNINGHLKGYICNLHSLGYCSTFCLCWLLGVFRCSETLQHRSR